MPPPRFISCPLCGQQFGSISIGIHVPQCYTKQVKRWELMDPRTRPPKPQMPMIGSGGGAGGRTISPTRVAVGGGRTAKGVAALHQQQATFIPPEEYSSMPQQLSKCRKCGRGFNFDRIQYHESVCKGSSGGPRKTFNSRKQRLGDFDPSEVRAAGGGFGRGRAGGRPGASAMPAPNRTNWRQQHEEFQAMVRAARRAAPPPQPTYVPPPRGPRQPFQRSVEHNIAAIRGRQAITNRDMFGARAPVPKRSAPGYAKPTSSSGGGAYAFGSSRSRFDGNPRFGGGDYKISMSNETSLGMRQAFGMA